MKIIGPEDSQQASYDSACQSMETAKTAADLRKAAKAFGGLEGYRDKIRQTALSKRLGQRRILKAFPTMKSPLHPEALQNLRDALMNLKDKKKK